MSLLIDSTYTHYPGTISGVVAWWDASDASTFTFSSGNVVQDWRSLVGSYTLTQATPANRPTRSGTVNGKSSVVFNGSSHSLSVNSFDLTPGGQKLSVWAVFSASSGGDQCLLEQTTNFNNNPGAVGLFRLTSNVAAFSKKGVNTYSSLETTGLITLAPKSFVATHDGTLSTNELQIYLNGSSLSTYAVNENTNSSNISATLFVGARAGSSIFLNGQICELGFTTTVLTALERQNLERYLIDKWGT